MKACWLQINTQLDFLRDVNQTLQPDHLIVHLEIVQVLHGKLRLIDSRIRSLFKEIPASTNGDTASAITSRQLSLDDPLHNTPVRSTQLRPWKYALIKEKLDSSITDLEGWQRVFDPSWYLILRSSNNKPLMEKIETTIATSVSSSNTETTAISKLLRAVPQKLLGSPKAHIFLPENGFATIDRRVIVGSTAAIGLRSSHTNRAYILETFDSPVTTRSDVVVRGVRDVASRLTAMEPQTFGLLRCKGVVRHKSAGSAVASSFTYVFHIPEGCSDPASLRQRLVERRSHSLSERFRIATEMAKAISFIHVLGFVHKNVRPDTILLCPRHDDQTLGPAYLIGFEKIRSADGHTFRIGEASWQKEMYQHPSRQGLVPEEAFVMQHDIYSLGVCLLELGLWESFITSTGDSHDQPCESLVSALNSQEGNAPVWDGRKLKEQLVRLAQTELAPKMGTRYTDVVLTCLTCLDPGNMDFGDEEEFHDEDGIIVGVRFIEKVSASITT